MVLIGTITQFFWLEGKLVILLHQSFGDYPQPLGFDPHHQVKLKRQQYNK